MSLGTGRYQPEVMAFFPKLGRGHTSKYPCPACKGGGIAKHSDQKGNREEWEANVGLRRTSKSTRGAARNAQKAIGNTDPKMLTTNVVVQVQSS